MNCAGSAYVVVVACGKKRVRF